MMEEKMCPNSYGISDEYEASVPTKNEALYQILERAKENGIEIEVER